MEKIAIGADVPDDVSLIKHWCAYEVVEELENVTSVVNKTNGDGSPIELNQTFEILKNRSVPVSECKPAASVISPWLTALN